VPTVGRGTDVLQPTVKGILEMLYSGRRKHVEISRVPYRRPEDRIRDLCSKAIVSDDSEFASVVSELRSAMHDHIEKIRTLAVRQLAGERPRGDKTGE
jgi:hypothetical protein